MAIKLSISISEYAEEKLNKAMENKTISKSEFIEGLILRGLE